MFGKKWCVVLGTLCLTATLVRAQDEEISVDELQQKVVFLCSMVSELQQIVLEIVQRTEENNKITRDIVDIISSNKEVYESNKEKLDVVVRSCDEMITQNGETLYRCKIKLNENPAAPKDVIKPLMEDPPAPAQPPAAKKSTKQK
jgi:hypothetical protein